MISIGAAKNCRSQKSRVSAPIRASSPRLKATPNESAIIVLGALSTAGGKTVRASSHRVANESNAETSAPKPSASGKMRKSVFQPKAVKRIRFCPVNAKTAPCAKLTRFVTW